jgi:hypothetical protein
MRLRSSKSFSILSIIVPFEQVSSAVTLTLREEHMLTVFENRVLRRIFGPKGNEVTGGWRKLRNEELHSLYSSPSTIRMIKSGRIRCAGHVI